jgi:hypothetical protein
MSTLYHGTVELNHFHASTPEILAGSGIKEGMEQFPSLAAIGTT